MVPQNIGERRLNITSILNNFKSKYIKKIGRKIITRKTINIIASEQK